MREMDRRVYKYGVIPPRPVSNDLRGVIERGAVKALLNDYLELLAEAEKTLLGAIADGLDTNDLRLKVAASRKSLKAKLNDFKKQHKPDVVVMYAAITPRDSGKKDNE